MCLITRQICPIKARKNIVCYKVLRKIPNTISVSFDRDLKISQYTKLTGKRPKYFTPYQEYLVNDVPAKLETQDKIDLRKTECFGKVYYQVHGGMFHAYTTARRQSFKLNNIVVKCIIPKGTLYFKGLRDEICAKTLILQEIV